MRIKRSASLSPRRPRMDEDGWSDFPHPHNIIVFEPDGEPDGLMSPILAPDGTPIIYEYISERMPFIGFIEFKDRED